VGTALIQQSVYLFFSMGIHIEGIHFKQSFVYVCMILYMWRGVLCW